MVISTFDIVDRPDRTARHVIRLEGPGDPLDVALHHVVGALDAPLQHRPTPRECADAVAFLRGAPRALACRPDEYLPLFLRTLDIAVVRKGDVATIAFDARRPVRAVPELLALFHPRVSLRAAISDPALGIFALLFCAREGFLSDWWDGDLEEMAEVYDGWCDPDWRPAPGRIVGPFRPGDGGSARARRPTNE